MKKQKIKLIKRLEVAKDVEAFYFEKPEDFTYKAGQFLEIKLPDFDAHCFSIASAPYEEEIMIATRKGKSDFKKALFSLPIGYEADVSMPHGTFTLHWEDDVTAVFIASGIGITPILSMIKQSAYNKRKQWQYLFYATKTIQDALFFRNSRGDKITPQEDIKIMDQAYKITKEKDPFIEELYSIQKQNPFFTFILFSPFHVNIQKEVKYYKNAKYYLCGSDKNIEEFRQLLRSFLISYPQIRTEDFPGYSSTA